MGKVLKKKKSSLDNGKYFYLVAYIMPQTSF